MFDFAQLAVGAAHRDEPSLERPPVFGLVIPLGKLGSERSDWAAQLQFGRVNHRSTPPSSRLPCDVIAIMNLARRHPPTPVVTVRSRGAPWSATRTVLDGIVEDLAERFTGLETIRRDDAIARTRKSRRSPEPGDNEDY
jgi:hypothetical protein